MALNSSYTSGNNQGGTQAAAGTATVSHTTGVQKQRFGGASWGGNTNRTFGRQQVSRTIQEYIDTMTKITKNQDNYADGGVSYKFIPVDASEVGGYFGSIMVVRTEKNISSAVTLLLGKTLIPLQDIETPRQVDSYGNQIGGLTTIPRVASDIYYGRLMQETLRRKLQEHYPNNQCVPLAPMFVPATVEPNNEDVLYSVLAHAFDGNEMFLNYMGAFDSGSLVLAPEYLDPRTERLHAVASYRKPDGVDAVNRPIRADSQVEVQVRVGNGNPEEGGEIASIVRTDGYFDAIWDGQKPNPEDRDWNTKNIATFIPAYIITNFQIGQQQRGFTLQHLALALASAGIHGERNSWLSAFAKDKLRPWVDTGALGKQVPKPNTPIASDGSFEPLGQYDDPDMITFANTTFYRDNLLYLIDIEEAGPLTPVLMPVGDSANGDANATDMIIKAWDVLFQGHASRIWNEMRNPPLFTSIDLRIPVGQCDLTDTSGIVDTRHLDNRYVNNTAALVEDAIRYEEAFYGTLSQGETRTELIARFQREQVTPHYDQYVRRYKVEPTTIELLIEAIRACGYTFVTEPNYELERRQSPRGTNRGDFTKGFGFSGGHNTVFTRDNGRRGNNAGGRSWTHHDSAYGRGRR